ncbi:hypothetical protein ACJ73_03275 [Blastomyces percursus]|uniref:Uncharacterized protein n=1 Tax=Blastomyces percursus TaxID=1658174 RepID=A0A1J9Q978_9EURO|nr:hypothetical protein ACJ73_03275 [Blastomyces percursus]
MAESHSKAERKRADAKPLHASFKSLSINTDPTTKKKPSRKKSSPVAESWEDEPLSSSSSDENEDGITPPAAATLRSPITTATTTTSSTGSSTPSSQLQTGTHAPPPTPISPQNTSMPRWVPDLPPASNNIPPQCHAASTPSPPSGMESRPEKQTAVASRMIAGALGIRAPKRTEEQRAYDRAMREKESKRKERERELANMRRMEEEKAKAAVWEE